MRNFFEKRDAWNPRLALWILATMAFAAPLALLSLRGLHLENDVEAWLPADDPEGRIYAWYGEQFPSDDRILISWNGSTIDDERIPQLRERLLGTVDEDGVRRGGVPYVNSVLTPGDVLARMTEHGVEEDDAAARLQGVLIGAGRLKLQLTPAGRSAPDDTLRLLAERVHKDLGVELEIHPAVEQPVIAAVDGTDADRPVTAIEIPPHDAQISWRNFRPHAPEFKRIRELALTLTDFATREEPAGRKLIEDCFIAPGSPVAVAVTLSEAGEAELTNTVEAIRAAAIAVGIPDDSLHLGGRPVALVELNRGVKAAAWNRAVPVYKLGGRSVLLLSGLVGIALALYFLRSLKLGALVIGATYFATLLGVALVPLTGHSMNMVLLVMPTLLMVLALSGAIHVANYWRHAAAEDSRTAIARAVQMARQPCMLASLTTAIGFLTLTASSLSPVRQFGVFAAAGTLIGLGVILYGLPALLHATQLRPIPVAAASEGRWLALGALLARRPWTVTIGCCVLFLAGIVGLGRFQTETKVVRNFPEDARLIRDYQFLEENLAGITPIDVVVRFSPESQEQLRFLQRLEIVRSIEDQVRLHPEISGALSLADFLPVHEDPGPDAKTRTRILYNRRSNETEKRIKEGSESGTSDFLVVAAESRDWLEPGDEGLNRAGDEMWKITAHAELLSDVDYGRLSTELGESIRSITRFHAGTDHVITGTAPLFDRTQKAIVRSLVKSFILAFFMIGTVMVIMLRNPLAALLAMLPNVLPIGFVFGVAAWCGQRIDVGAMITASVALGIAVDGTLHLLTWFREGLRRGLSRQRAVMEALAHCAPAMWQTSIAVCIGLLMLAPAELVLVSRFGWLMSALIGAALFADLILLPAMLAGPLGAVMERSVPVRLKTDDVPAKPHRTSPHVRFQPGDRDAVRPAV